MPRYEIVILMDAGTVGELAASGFLLHAAQEMPDAQPVPFLTTGDYTTTTSIAFTVQYRGCAPVELGQRLTYDGCIVTDDGVAGAIQLFNDTPQTRTCTIDVSVDDIDCGALATFTMVGMSAATIAPTEHVLLIFATEPVHIGPVITRTSGPYLTLDMTNAPAGRRTVRYAMGEGWSVEEA
jgi:hypothetical protein